MTYRNTFLLTMLCVALLPLAAPADLAAQPRNGEEQAKWSIEEFPNDELERLEAEGVQRQQEMDRELEEWENEQARRRDDEGAGFDEVSYDFERSLMARRRELAERRMRLDVETHRGYRELDADFRALEEEQQRYWVQRQRSDMASEAQRWEAEQQRRRDDEGEHFDEEASEFERGMMARRRELEERRIRLDEGIHQAYRDLDGQGLPGHVADEQRRTLGHREQEQREALDADFRALEEEQQRYWVQRQRSDMDRFEREWEAEQQRRREEEGEDFDEEAYEIGQGMIARRRQLEEHGLRLNEEISQAYRDLDARALAADEYDRARQALERREQRGRDALDAELHALEEEAQQHRARMERSGEDHRRRGDADQDEHAKDE